MVNELPIVASLPKALNIDNAIIKQVFRYRCGISDSILEYLSCFESESISFKDEYYFDILITENIWIKQRTFENKKEWIVKYNPERVSSSRYLEISYNTNPFNVDLTNPVAVYNVNRTTFKIGTNQVKIDRITYPEGDPACCCLIELVNSYSALDNTIKYVLSNSFFPIRNKLHEFLFRYNQNLYQQLTISTENRPFLTCILNEQYKDMEKDGIEQYSRRMDLIDGLGFCKFENYDDYLLTCTNESCLIIPAGNIAIFNISPPL